MNWRWLIFDYIPRELDVPKVQRRAIQREVNSVVYQSTKGKLLFLLGFVYFLTFLLTLRMMTDHLSIIYSLLGWAVYYLLIAMFGRSLYESKTYHLLRRYGYEICAECGYLLRGLASDSSTCPECGAEITKPSPS